MVCTPKVYSELGADIVMESITPTTWPGRAVGVVVPVSEVLAKDVWFSVSRRASARSVRLLAIPVLIHMPDVPVYAFDLPRPLLRLT